MRRLCETRHHLVIPLILLFNASEALLPLLPPHPFSSSGFRLLAAISNPGPRLYDSYLHLHPHLHLHILTVLPCYFLLHKFPLFQVRLLYTSGDIIPKMRRDKARSGERERLCVDCLFPCLFIVFLVPRLRGLRKFSEDGTD